MSYQVQLHDLLTNHTATLGIVGLGYVGLPLAVEFAEVGFDVIGIDVNAEKVDLINQGVSYIQDISTDHLAPLVKSGKIKATTDYAALQNVNTISICVPTPLRKTKDPDMTYILQAVASIINNVQKGTLIILESTTYPGTTHELIGEKLKGQGFTLGEDIFVAFSPERIDPGNQIYTVKNTPKVVGGITPNCTALAQDLYGQAVNEVVPVSNPTTAEMVKLLENTFRAVNIGLVNEMALICDRLGIDVWEVINAAATKPFGFMPFYPGPGLGGHCIPVDPHYLSWKLKTMNYTARFIELASEINTSMPLHVVSKITDALNEDSKAVNGAMIVVLGVAYKPDIDDVRESPALDIISILQDKGANIVYHDPYVNQIRIANQEILTSTDYTRDLLTSADAVVIVTNHSTYDWQEVVDISRLVIDTRYATADYSGSARVVSL